MMTNSEVDFHGTIIAGDLICDQTEFAGVLDFRSPSHYPKTHIEGKGSFNEASFGARPRLSGSVFGEFIDMVIKANQAVDKDPKRIFLDMLELNTYESTFSFD